MSVDIGRSFATGLSLDLATTFCAIHSDKETTLKNAVFNERLGLHAGSVDPVAGRGANRGVQLCPGASATGVLQRGCG